MKLVVLAGGFSPERDVSLTSGALIARALTENGHAVAYVDSYLGVECPPEGLDALFTHMPPEVPHIGKTAPNLEALRRTSGNGDAYVGKNVAALCKLADRTVLALHGGVGEDGRLQAFLDCEGIRYTGAGALGCALAMDKNISKLLFRAAGIPTPDWCYFPAGSDEQAACTRILEELGIPCVVKPVGCGSSVGVTMAETEADLTRAVREAGTYGAFLAERKIAGRELTVGVLGGRALPVVEILPPEHEFYDYKNKYSGSTREVCPAPILQAVTERVQALSLAGMQALSLCAYARFDYMLDENGEAWCLEANALPGMTPTSLLPLAAKTAGISYSALCEEIVKL